MTDWYLGTMGFSYQDWVGPFYPQAMVARGFLSHYARFFNAVELDSTFYGTPRVATVKRWAAVTPRGFRFCVKTPRLITHDKGLIDAHREMGQFVDVMRGLGEKLGVILIQFPASFSGDRAPVLNEFLQELPPDVRFAVEFRHPNWHQPQTAEMLRDLGIAWAGTEYPKLPRGVQLTTDFVYIRWIGQHGRFQRHDRERIDVTPNMAWWQENLQSRLAGVRAVFGFFNNDYAGFAAGTCQRFKAILDMPAKDIRPPQQGRLF